MAGFLPHVLPSVTASAVSDGGATETVVLTSRPVNTPGPHATVTLFGVVNLTVGTNGVAAVVRVRRGSLTGTEIGTATTDTGVATDKYTIPFQVVDTSIDEAGAVYVVTVQETSASADGTVNYVTIGGLIT